MSPRRLAGVFAVLILLATAAFVIGVSIERSSGHSESTSEHTASAEGAESHEEGEVHEEGEGGHADRTGDNESHADESETIAGIDVESTPIVAVGVVLSLALAGAALRWPRREVFTVAAAFCLAFAVLDGRELAHQLDEDAGDIATFAALALLFHLAAAGAATLAAARGRADQATAVAA